MNKLEAKEVLTTIFEYYPAKFQLTERKLELLLPKLLEMDYEMVMYKLNNFVINSPFPPTLSEIAAYESNHNDEHLLNIEKWEEEAAKVPEELRQQFREKFQKLIEVKRNDNSN